MKFSLTFPTLRRARNFGRGYCVPRVIVRAGREFAIISPSTATRRNLRVVEAC